MNLFLANVSCSSAKSPDLHIKTSLAKKELRKARQTRKQLRQELCQCLPIFQVYFIVSLIGLGPQSSNYFHSYTA
jgi:hypothetical protein